MIVDLEVISMIDGYGPMRSETPPKLKEQNVANLLDTEIMKPFNFDITLDSM